MKKIYTLFLIIWGTVSFSMAQSFTANEFPAIDDTLMMWQVSDTSGIPTPTSGNLQTWDYSTLQFNKSTILNYRFITPSAGTNGNKFTGANIAVIEPGGQAANTIFYNRTSNIVEIVGANLLGNTALVYSDKETFFKFPINLSGSSSDTYGGSVSSFGGSTTTRDGSISTEGFGLGTLKLPGKIYNNAILIKIVSDYIDSVKSFVGNFGTLTIETRYLWFIPGERGWVFEIRNTDVTNGFTGTISTKTVYMKQVAINTGGILHPFTSYSIYPNPATNKLYIEGDFENHSSSLLSITDISGRLVMTNITLGHDKSISVENLDNGIYILHINNTGYKFIKN